MTFLWPEFLWLLALVPLLVAAYLVILGRKRKSALRYASLSMVKEAMGAGQRFRRHVPPLLFLVSLVLMIAAIARPAAVVRLPSQHETVILSMDVSGSMRAKDVEPDRLTAAQVAAKAFVNDTPRSTRIGIVAFAGTASLVQAPTQSRQDLVTAIDRFQLQRATAIGSGILVALKAIFPDAEFDLRGSNPRGDRRIGGKAEKPPAKPAAPPGSYQSAAIILLSDGQATTGPDPIEAARMAAERGVRVFTVGIGTPNGEILVGEGWSMRVRLDEETLKGIAKITGAEYFYAGTAVDLKKIYQALNSRFVMEKKETEITALFAAAAALAALVSALLSLLWFNRIL
ncbi:MAG: VWA domain-containing protein [Burkholderiales bacterium]